ncbi:putative 3prime [Diplonema papillatum]|nr:putative 3prime [Diplonema papillatum]
MGCGAGQKEAAEQKGTNYKVDNANGVTGKGEQPKVQKTAPGQGKGGDQQNGSAKVKDPAPTPNEEPPAQPPLQNREKSCPAPLLREIVEADDCAYLVSHYANKPGLRGSVFAVRDSKGRVFWKEYTDPDLTALKDANLPQLGWGAFWRSFTNAFVKDDNLLRVNERGAQLEFTLKSSKEPKPYTLLIPLSETPDKAPEDTYRHFIEPFTTLYKRRKERKDAVEGEGKKDKGLKEEDAEVKEATLNSYEAAVEDSARDSKELDAKLGDLRKKASEAQQEFTTLQNKVDKIVKSIRSCKGGNSKTLHPLDGLYLVGGARPFQHSTHAAPYFPTEQAHEPVWLTLLEDGRITEATPDSVSCLTKPPTDPEVAELVEGLPDDKVWQLIECYEHLDKWETFDAFVVDEITEGRCLFYSTYVLFIKYGFIQHFKLDKEVVINFLSAIQAGYYPNRYHNAMHAADVMQITHFVLGPGGMKAKCKLSMEDQLAAIIAAAIHDYNHPGLNNNFHTKVSAYLGTLYNDRSILENHHCACVFELMQHKKYDIMQFLNDDQKKDVRDTIVEMLLSTDMGNHAKIFSAFRRRLSEGTDWAKKKEDIRLALVMAIKLADISNCARPTELYLKWANRIAEEFYIQGDAEAQLGIPISPFMNRRTHEKDFHKGQVSFMNYIVTPLFETVSELLPRMRFAAELCTTNRDYWTK